MKRTPGDGKKLPKKRKWTPIAEPDDGAAGSASSQQGPPDSAEGSLEDEVEVSNSCSAILQRAKASIGQGGITWTTKLELGLLKPRRSDAGNAGGHRAVS